MAAAWVGLALPLPATLGAQGAIADEPAFVTYGMSTGLSQASIQALFQDRTGFLWVGTQGGLNRFDGLRFRSYYSRPGDSTSLSDNYIEALADAGDGSLWVGTNRGGLNYFDAAAGVAERFGMFDLGPWSEESARGATDDRAGRTVHGIASLSDGSLLLASDVGLIRFETGPRTYSLLLPVPRGPTPTTRISVCELGDGRALASLPDPTASDGLEAPAPATWSIAAVDGTRTQSIVSLPSPVSALRCPRAGAAGYAATTDGSVYAFGPGAASAHRLLRLPGGGSNVRDLLRGADGRLWIATLQGLRVQEREGGAARRVGTSPSSGLQDPQVLHLLADRTGVLWVGTWNGLSAMHPLGAAIRRVPNARGDAPGIPATGVIAIEGAGPGQVWIGTNNGGLHLLRGDEAAEALLLDSPPALAPLAGARIMDVTGGPGGETWIAALERGVYRFDSARTRLDRVPIASPEGDGERQPVYRVFVDRGGEVWAGTLSHGLVRLDRAGDRFRPFRGPRGDWDFGSDWVWPIVEDAGGTLWVGAMAGGLSRIDPERRRQRLYAAAVTGLSSDRILTLFIDSRGWVWIGTEGGGLNRLDPQSDEFRSYTAEDGLPHDNVQGITEDHEGALWISTNDGIARFDVERETFRVFRERVGVLGNRFFANGVYRGERGEIYFGGEGGLTVVDPRRMTPGDQPPDAALTSFFLNGREVPLSRAVAPGGLDLAPRENFFAFEFAALDFRDPTENRYRYRLVELDPDWIDSGTNRLANYTSVPPGRYTFRVAARNSDGIWNEEAISIPVRVRAPYYQTVWFRSLMLMLLLGLVSGVYAYRLNELKRRQDLRLGIAGRLHDDIGANLSAIALKAGLLERSGAMDEPHRGQLADVGRLARDSALKVRETVWVVNTKYDSLPGLLTKMRDTADTMLGGHTALRFSMPDTVPDRRIPMELRQDVYLAFKEALQNVAKHAQAKTVSVEVTVKHQSLVVRVSDDGKGFDRSSPSAGSGNGMGLMRARIERHGGELTVTSGSGIGTTVLLRVGLR